MHVCRQSDGGGDQRYKGERRKVGSKRKDDCHPAGVATIRDQSLPAADDRSGTAVYGLLDSGLRSAGYRGQLLSAIHGRWREADTRHVRHTPNRQSGSSQLRYGNLGDSADRMSAGSGLPSGMLTPHRADPLGATIRILYSTFHLGEYHRRTGSNQRMRGE